MSTTISNSAYGAATEGQLGLVNGEIARNLARTGQTTAPTSGQVGEFKIAVCTANTPTVSSNGYVDVTGTSIELTPGIWMIGFDVHAYFTWVSGGASYNANIAMTDSSNNIVPNAVGGLNGHLASATDSFGNSVSRCVSIVVTSTTYKLRVRVNGNNTAMTCNIFPQSYTGGLSDPDTSSNIWAIRIA